MTHNVGAYALESYSLFKISGRRVFLTLLNTNCILMSVSQSAKEISIKLIGMGI